MNIIDNNSMELRNKITLSGEGLTLGEFVSIARQNAKVELSPASLVKVDAARKCIDDRLLTGEIYYGINTGFGALSNIHIHKDKTKELQLNLIRSHACGVGDPLEANVVRGILALRIQTMLRGNSGIKRETILLMQEFLNRNIIPVVPSKGSVGACGDLAPLAHIALCLIGEGKVHYQGEIMSSLTALKKENLTPLSPEAKEGLCLINGTQVMTAIGLLACYDSLNLLKTADVCAAMTLEALKGTPTAFRPDIQAIRPHSGQEIVASNVRSLLAASDVRSSHINCDKVQDPYSIRCVPQVHGAVRNAWIHTIDTLLTEANSSTDNPLVFPETNEIISGGNFHGEPVALVLDYLAIAMSEIANICERRIEKLVNPHMSGLPAFLAKDSGLNSGYMILHVVAAALVSENKVFSHPASVDSIPTSAEKEDHVSMGMTSALKLRNILKNVTHCLAIEALAAADGLEFHKPMQPGEGIKAAVKFIRSHVAPMEVDRSMAEDIEWLAQKITNDEFIQAIENNVSYKLA